jgi:capsular exopolysaccharide synthesis family protein
MSTRANSSKSDKPTQSSPETTAPEETKALPEKADDASGAPEAIRPEDGSPGDTYPERIGGIAETGQYERLISQMLFSGPDQHYMLAVTSAASGEGVTTTAVELGIALAQSTTKTVAIVDANLHRPALHTAFSAALQPGLRELIGEISSRNWEPGFAQSAEWVRGFLRTNLPNLSVLPSGCPGGNPSQLMTSEAAEFAMRSISVRFDYVVLDCPPILSSVEAGMLCRLADGVAIVVRAGLTPREDVLRARHMLEGARVTGVILNGV